jgi:hypothetical protein
MAMSDETISYVIMFVAVVILVIFLVEYVRSGGKRNAECKRMNSLYPNLNSNIVSITNDDPTCRYNLSDYYIKTAYNACSGGNYTNDYVDICNLTAVIKQGARCLDFEIFSIDDNPVVATSTSNNYRIKETYNSVSFSNVMNTINSYAFGSGTCPNYTDPLIIHLRLNSNNQKMFTNLAKIFATYSYRMLGSNYALNSLASAKILALKQKIILIVDKSNNAFLENNDLVEFVNMTSNSMYMRAYRFKDIKEHDTELLGFNRQNMTIVFPDKGSNPPNPNAKLCRDNGCQMVAMRYQTDDAAFKEDEKFFNQAGHAFALKFPLPETQTST